MAARLNPRHQDSIRQKIQADRLLAWLQAGIFGTKFQKRDVVLTAERVSAAKALLNKCLPDLTRSEIDGSLSIKKATDLTDAELLAIASAGRKPKS